MLTRRDLGKHTSKCYSGNLHFLLQCFQETGGYIEKLEKKKKKQRENILMEIQQNTNQFCGNDTFQHYIYVYTQTHIHSTSQFGFLCSISLLLYVNTSFFSSNAINFPHHSRIVIRTKLFSFCLQ